MYWVRYIYGDFAPFPTPDRVIFLGEFVRFFTRGTAIVFTLMVPLYYFKCTLKRFAFYASIVFMILYFFQAVFGGLVRVYFHDDYLRSVISVDPLLGAWLALLVALLMLKAALVLRRP